MPCAFNIVDNIQEIIMVFGRYRLALLIGFIILFTYQSIVFAKTNLDGEKLVSKADSLRAIGQNSTAVELYRSAIHLFQSQENMVGEAHALRGMGIATYSLGVYDSALVCWEKAYQIFREKGERKFEGKVLNNFGTLYSSLSEYEKAIEYLSKSLTIAREMGDAREEGISLQNLGNVYLWQSNFPKALDSYQQSLRIFRDIGHRQYEVITLLSIGSVYYYLHDYERAYEYYNNSLIITKELGDRNMESYALDNIGIIHGRLKEYSKALDYHQRSLTLLKELGDQKREGKVLNNIGVVYSQLEDYQHALECYQKSLCVFRDVGDKIGEGSSLLNIGGIYRSMGKCQEGLKLIQTGLGIVKDLGADDYVRVGHITLGDCNMEMGEISQAQENYVKAIESVEGIRGKLEVEAQKSSYASGTYSIYEKMVTLLLINNQLEKAFNYMERGRARSFLDILGDDIQVNKSTHEECLSGNTDSDEYEPELRSVKTEQPLTLPEVQSLLNPECTLLEFFLTENKVLIWAITSVNADLIEENIAGDSLQCLVESFRETILMHGSPDYLSRELYNVLIAPISDKISTKRLIIVPHGTLHYLPFQALQDQDGKYLFEKFQITYLPSASVMEYLSQKEDGRYDQILAFGNPTANREGCKSIEFSRHEVERIGQVFLYSEIYTDSNATESVFRERATEHNILHLACHAELNSSYPMYSGLLLAPSEGYDGELDVHEIFTLDLDASLVVLSACQTGLGKLTTGDELVGLSRAFLAAGAHSLVSSLWTVYDESTGYFMECFYRNLQTHCKAESMQMAQLSTKEKYADIYYWAPFMLIGQAF